MATVEKSAKLEKKLTLHLGGYQNRAKMLRGKMGEAAEALEKARSALSAFRTLAISEDITIRSRREALMEEVTHVTRREREAQEEYRRNREELDSLVAGQGQAGVVNGYH